MGEKVYTLLRTSSIEGEPSYDVRVFYDIEKAIKTMQDEFNAELNDWKGVYHLDMLEIDDDTLTKSIFEKGFYNDNHIDWTIEEQDVIE